MEIEELSSQFQAQQIVSLSSRYLPNYAKTNIMENNQNNQGFILDENKDESKQYKNRVQLTNTVVESDRTESRQGFDAQQGYIFKEDREVRIEGATVRNNVISSPVNSENNNIVRDVCQNSHNWRIEVIQEQTCLIHNSARKVDSEVGTLIHKMQIHQAVNANQQQAYQQQQSFNYYYHEKNK